MQFVTDDISWRLAVAIGTLPALFLIRRNLDKTRPPIATTYSNISTIPSADNHTVSYQNQSPPTEQQTNQINSNKRIESSLSNPPKSVASVASQDLPIKDMIDKWFLSLEHFKEELKLAYHSRTLRTYLLWTSFSWFCFDVYFFGNVFMQARLLRGLLLNNQTINHFDDDDNNNNEFTQHTSISIETLAILGIFSSLLFWIGGLISIPALQRVSALGLQLQGFFLSSVCFILVLCFRHIKSNFIPGKYLSILFYLLSYVTSGMGPAPTTFLLPSLLFPSSIRSTANGIAAAAGKTGSIIGIILSFSLHINIDILMGLYSSISLLGFCSTLLLVRKYITSDTMNTSNKNKDRPSFLRSASFSSLSSMTVSVFSSSTAWRRNSLTSSQHQHQPRHLRDRHNHLSTANISRFLNGEQTSLNQHPNLNKAVVSQPTSSVSDRYGYMFASDEDSETAPLVSSSGVVGGKKYAVI